MSPRQSSGTAVRAELSKAAIVERALAVMDIEGPDAVTIRRVAQEFGVTPMALYWHVKNKDELLAAVGDSFFEGMTVPPKDGNWSSRLRAVMELLMDALRRHPAAAPLALPRVLMCPSGLAVTEYTLALLSDAGFTVAQSADLARAALQTAIMMVSQAPGAETQAALAERDQILAAKRQHIAALSIDRYPNLVAAIGPLLDCADDQAYYSFGIDLYMEGAEALLRRQKRAAKAAR